MLQSNRKAVSIMVGYVLLIAIAIALSTAVFFYLRLYLPDEKVECDVDIKLSIDSVSCVLDSTNSFSIIELNLTNRGLFKIEGAYVKIGDEGRVFRNDLNPDLTLMSTCNGNIGFLNPGDRFCKIYTYNSVPTLPQEISVQPVIWKENEPILCPEAVVVKTIDCVSP